MDQGKAAVGGLAGNANCAMVARPLSVVEEINQAIEETNQRLARLLELRASAQARGLATMGIEDLRKFAFPGNAIF